MVDISLDPGFAEFYDWTLKNNVPVIVLSSGMEPIIRALLAKFLGPKANSIPIISNNVEIAPDKSWKIIYRDESRTPPQLLRHWFEILDMTSLERLDRMHNFRTMDGQFWFTVEMECRISVLHEKQIFYSPRRDEI